MDTFNNPYTKTDDPVIGDGELNSCTDVTTFDLLQGDNTDLTSNVSGTIGDSTIDLSVPQGFDISGLVPYIRIDGESISPEDGARIDFSEGPVAYRVTAEDGSQKDYFVTVDNGRPAAPGAPDLNSSRILYLTGGDESDFNEFRFTYGAPIGNCSDGFPAQVYTEIVIPAGTITINAIACDNFGNASDLTTRVYSYNTNLVKNGSFEQADPLKWYTGASSYFARMSDVKKDGIYSMGLTNDGNTATANLGPLKQDIIISRDTNYELTLSMKLSSETNKGSLIFDTNDVFDSSDSCQFTLSDSQKGMWKNFSCTFNSGGTESLKIRFFDASEDPLDGTGYLDNVILTKIP